MRQNVGVMRPLQWSGQQFCAFLSYVYVLQFYDYLQLYPWAVNMQADSAHCIYSEGFTDKHELQIILLFLFLAIYLHIMQGNLALVLLVLVDLWLHTLHAWFFDTKSSNLFGVITEEKQAPLTITPRDGLKILLPVSTTLHSQEQRLKDAMKNILKEIIV